MAMKKIADIRLFKSDKENTSGSFPDGFGCPTLVDYSSRLAARLRLLGFKLDGFDMLYVDFNCALPEGAFCEAQRPKDKLFPGYRFYEVGVSRAMYEKLDGEKMLYPVLNYLRLLLNACFMYGGNTPDMVTRAIYEVAKFGEDLSLEYRKKENGEYSVTVNYRFSNDGRTIPSAAIIRLSDGARLNAILPEIDDIEQITEIRILKNSVVFKYGREGGYAGVREYAVDLAEMG